MSVSPEDILRLARLAELAIDPADLPTLSTQMDRILTFVAQLSDLGNPADAPERQGAPVAGRLRVDEVEPAAMVRGPQAMAPEFVDGFFLVPRLSAMDDQ